MHHWRGTSGFPFPILVLLSFLLLTPYSLGSGLTKTFYPPYLTAQRTIGHSQYADHAWNGTVTTISPPAANKSTGAISMALKVQEYKGGSSKIQDYVGFRIPFRVSASGTHNVTVAWTLHWVANATGQRILLPGTWGYIAASGSVHASVTLSLWDSTTGAFWSVSGPRFVDLSFKWSSLTNNSSKTSTGYLNTSLSIVQPLNNTDRYQLWTTVNVGLWADGKGRGVTPQAVGSSAFFDMAGAYGGKLLWASVS